MAKELQKSIFCEFVPFHVKAHPTFTAQSSVSKMTASSWPLSEGEFQDSRGFQPKRFYKFPCGLPACTCLTVSRPKIMHCQMAGMTWQSGRSGCRPPRRDTWPASSGSGEFNSTCTSEIRPEVVPKFPNIKKDIPSDLKGYPSVREYLEKSWTNKLNEDKFFEPLPCVVSIASLDNQKGLAVSPAYDPNSKHTSNCNTSP